MTTLKTFVSALAGHIAAVASRLGVIASMTRDDLLNMTLLNFKWVEPQHVN